jgi:hypothetical protein
MMAVTAMAMHLPRLLETAGASTIQAVAAGAMMVLRMLAPASWKGA